MMLVANCWKPVACESNDVFAVPTNKPSTKAAIVATSPVPSLMTSFDSWLKCPFGSTRCK